MVQWLRCWCAYMCMCVKVGVGVGRWRQSEGDGSDEQLKKFRALHVRDNTVCDWYI